MTSLRNQLRDRIGWWMIGGACVAVLAATKPAQAAPALDLLYERTVMVAADDRCGLFSPQIAAALDASFERMLARYQEVEKGHPELTPRPKPRGKPDRRGRKRRV